MRDDDVLIMRRPAFLALGALSLALGCMGPPETETPLPKLEQADKSLVVSVRCSDDAIGKAKESLVYHTEILPADQKRHKLAANGKECSGVLIGPRAILTAGHCIWAYKRRPFPRVRIWVEHVTAASTFARQTKEYWPAVPRGRDPPVWYESLDPRNDMAMQYDGFVGHIPDLALIVIPNATGFAGLAFPTLGWPGGTPKAVISSTNTQRDFVLCKGFQTADGTGYRRRAQNDYDHAVVARLNTDDELDCVNTGGGWTYTQGGDSGAAWYTATSTAPATAPFLLPQRDQRVLGVESGTFTVRPELGGGRCGDGVSAEVATKLDNDALTFIRRELRARIPRGEQGDYPVLSE